MLITISDRDEFVNRFLTPLSKLSESACITVHSDHLQALVTNADNSLILYATFFQPNPEAVDGTVLNVPNISRFINLF